MNELTIQLMTISIVLFVFFVCTTCMAVTNWNIVGKRNGLVFVLREQKDEVTKKRNDAESNKIEITSAYLSMCNKCDSLKAELNRTSFITNDLISKDHELLCKDNESKKLIKELHNKNVDLKILLACKVDELEKPKAVKSKLSKIELNMIQAATKTLDILVQSMPMLSPMEIDAFTRCSNAIEDMKLATKSLLIWENDEFYLLPIKTMGDLVDIIDTIIKKVDADAPKFTKVLEVARAKIVLALDNKPQNKE